MSRHRKTGALLICLLALVLLTWLDHNFIRHRWQRQSESEEQARAYDYQKYHTKTLTVVNVVDGDTVDVDAPDGKYQHTRVRLWGVDAPEINSDEFGVMYFGPEAAEFAIKLTFGKPVTIYLDKGNRTRGKYDRLLAYVQLPDGRFLNEVLVAEGFAYADLRFRHSFYNRYRQLEAGARNGKKGLWQKVTRERLPEWLQREKPKLLLNK